jgi:hypothetical protein
MRRWLNLALILTIIATAVIGAIAGYAHLVASGVLPAPTRDHMQAMQQAAEKLTSNLALLLLALLIIIPMLLAAVAPLIYAARSGDVITSVICLALTVVTWMIVFSARTSIDLCFAGLVYLAAMVLSVGVYNANASPASAARASFGNNSARRRERTRYAPPTVLDPRH